MKEKPTPRHPMHGSAKVRGTGALPLKHRRSVSWASGLAALGVLLQTSLAWAACNNNTPPSNSTVNCTGEDTIGVQAGASDNVVVNVDAGAAVSAPFSLATILLNSNATINNLGSVSADPELGIGVLLQGGGLNLTNSGSITGAIAVQTEPSANTDIVTNTGAIAGTFLGIILQGQAINVTNSGLIQGDAVGLASNNSAGGGFTLINEAGGRIVATNVEGTAVSSVFFDSANTSPDRIVNAGTIESSGLAIEMGGGDDSLELRPTSSITGDVRAGDGSDTFILGGTGTGSFDLAIIGDAGQYQEFETFRKEGAGTWNLTGSGSQDWTLAAGRLNVQGTLSGAVTVDAGAQLGGAGSVGTLTVNGTIAPGNSIGTLTVNGNFTQAAGSVYEVEANAAGQNDLINVTGLATIQGGTVNVLAAPGNYTPNTAYTILNVAGGVTGTYQGVTDNLDFLDASLHYQPNSVLLNLARNDLNFGPPPVPPPGSPQGTPPPAATPFVAQTPNQAAVGTNLDVLENRATGDLRTIFNRLTSGTIEQARLA